MIDNRVVFLFESHDEYFILCVYFMLLSLPHRELFVQKGVVKHIGSIQNMFGSTGFQENCRTPQNIFHSMSVVLIKIIHTHVLSYATYRWLVGFCFTLPALVVIIRMTVLSFAGC